MRRVWYMAVTSDICELPVCVGTCEEVAAYAGITAGNLMSQVSKTKRDICNGKRHGIKFVTVERDD